MTSKARKKTLKEYQRVYQKKYRLENKDRIKATRQTTEYKKREVVYGKRYRRKHKKQLKAYYQKNKVKKLARQKALYFKRDISEKDMIGFIRKCLE